MMPHTGVNVEYHCFDNGTLSLIGPMEDVPVCVPKQSCRLLDFPESPANRSGYTHNNTDKGKGMVTIVYYIYLISILN